MLDKIFRVLDCVRFIPELKRNFISLDTLNATSYSVKFSNGIIKVMKGSLVTFRANRVNGFYLLQIFTLDLSGKVSLA